MYDYCYFLVKSHLHKILLRFKSQNKQFVRLSESRSLAHISLSGLTQNTQFISDVHLNEINCVIYTI